MNQTLKYIGVLFLLVGCTTKGKGLLPPVQLQKETSGSCEWVNREFRGKGTRFVDGELAYNNAAFLHSIFEKCTLEASCKAPPRSYNTEFVKFTYVHNDGLHVEFSDKKGELLGVSHIGSSSVTCNGGALSFITTSGMTNDGPGAWTVGIEKRAYMLSKSANMELVVREEITRFDVFWFGLPVTTNYVAWDVYNQKN